MSRADGSVISPFAKSQTISAATPHWEAEAVALKGRRNGMNAKPSVAKALFRELMGSVCILR